MKKKVERLAYNLHEAAEATGVSVFTIRRLVRSGAIDSLKMGGRRVVTAKALMEYIDKQRLKTVNSI